MDVTVTCPCPGTPHPDGDTVTLKDKPGLHLGATVLGWANRQGEANIPTIGDIMETYLREGVVDWTFTLENGDHRPCDDEGLDWLMDDYELAYPIANAAAEVYTEAIFRPLGVKMEPTPSSRTSRNTRSTSRKSRPSPSRP